MEAELVRQQLVPMDLQIQVAAEVVDIIKEAIVEEMVDLELLY